MNTAHPAAVLDEAVDITPTWSGMLPVLLLLLESGSAKGRADARDELSRMAKLADRQVAIEKRARNSRSLLSPLEQAAEHLLDYRPEGATLLPSEQLRLAELVHGGCEPADAADRIQAETTHNR